jgi:hypothetical protein
MTRKLVVHRDHSWRNSYPPQGERGRRVVVLFEWLAREWLVLPRLVRSDRKDREQNQTSEKARLRHSKTLPAE